MGAITAGLGSCDAGAERLFTATLTGRGGGGRAGCWPAAAGPAHTGASDGKVSAGRTEQNSSEVRGAGLGRVTPPHPHA